MKTTTEAEELDKLSFARRAATLFRENTALTSYTDNGIEQGCYLGMRWGADNDCILVLKLDDVFEPVVYGQIIRQQE